MEKIIEDLDFFNELIKQSFDCPLCEDTGKVGYYREPDDWVEEACSCRTQVREELDTENYIYQSKEQCDEFIKQLLVQ